MKNLLLLALLLSLGLTLHSQLPCPNDLVLECSELGDPMPNIVVDPGKLELVASDLMGKGGCETQEYFIEYYLLDLVEDETEETASCTQEITVLPFDPSTIQWPESPLFLQGAVFDDIDPALISQGLTPSLDNYCNFVFSYVDQILSGNRVVRKWTGLDWCTAEVHTFTTVILCLAMLTRF